MLNQLVVVGRLSKEIEMRGEELAIMELAIRRAFKNEEGIYDTDLIEITITGGIAKNTAEYCKKGDIIGVKGRVAKTSADGQMRVIGEKVTFLSSRPKDNEENTDISTDVE